MPPQIGGEDIFIYFVSENKTHNFLNTAGIYILTRFSVHNNKLNLGVQVKDSQWFFNSGTTGI